MKPNISSPYMRKACRMRICLCQFQDMPGWHIHIYIYTILNNYIYIYIYLYIRIYLIGSFTVKYLGGWFQPIDSTTIGRITLVRPRMFQQHRVGGFNLSEKYYPLFPLFTDTGAACNPCAPPLRANARILACEAPSS